MKKLKDLLYRCSIQRVVGNLDITVDHITFDSRTTTPGSVFVAVKGTVTDGHNYITDVIKKGIAAVVCESLPADFEKRDEVCFIVVKNSSEALGYLACNYYDNPSEKLKLTGITGTNGKTTTVTLLYELFKLAGYKVGLISTVNNLVIDKIYSSTHTTPDPIQLNSLLDEMVNDGCEYCFMEVSSHAIVQHRVTGLQFAGGIFSNLTHDHLDFHKTFDAYLQAKKMFFDKLPSGAFALVNIDDRNGRVMVQNTKARVHTMALRKSADFHCKILENQFDGLQLNINGKEVWSHLVGNFNAYNLLAIYSTARLLGIEEQEALILLSKLHPVAGRFEYFRSPEGVVGIVDYAHTPDALKNVIDTINEIRSGAGKLITVVGAGGDRDKAKRPVMARIAIDSSNTVVLTSDNPRSEDPVSILDDMLEGIPIEKKRNCLIIPDRYQAIMTACNMAVENDVILIAGKGHETYQEINGVRTHFDDREVLKEFFSQQG